MENSESQLHSNGTVRVEENAEPSENDPLTQNSQKFEEKKNTSFRERISDFRSNITVEPMMILFITSVMISNMSNQNLMLEKTCRVNLNFSKEVCDALERRETENYTTYEKEVQKLTAYIAAMKTVLSTIIPCALILFVGAYSDRTGKRKLFIILPIFGEMLSCLANIVHVYFFFELSAEALAITEGLFPALGGGFCTLFMGAFSFISDVTKPESRTFRMGVLNFCMTVGFPLGMGLSGILLNKFGFYAVYAIASSLHCTTIAYGLFFLKDPQRTEDVQNKSKVNFFNISRAKETLSVMCSGPSHRNRRIWLLLTAICMLFGPMYGEISVLYLSTRYRFNWEAVSFSVYLVYHFVVHSFGTVFSIVVLSRVLKWHDSMLGIISTVSKVAGAFVSALAKTGKQFYLGPLVEIMNGTSLLVLRSTLSKMVSSEEQGKINSVIGLAEQMMPLVYTPLYTKVYSSTLSFFPGAVFFVSAVLTFIPAIIFVYLFVEHRRLQKTENSKLKHTPELAT